MGLSLMAPKGQRTPLDLWWVAVVVVTVLMLALDWSVAAALGASVSVAVVLGAAHLVVSRRRQVHRERRRHRPT